MTDEMMAAMATDLNIRQFVNENQPQFINRLLYSGMACWIKTAAMDAPITFSLSPDQNTNRQETKGVSRRHILDRCDSILTEMLCRFPASKLWFETTPGNEKAIQLIRSRLVRHGDLLNVGFQTNLTLAPESVIPLNPDLECGKGYLLDTSFSYSGIAMIRRQQTEYLFKENDRIDSCKWLKNYIKSAWWKPANLPEDVEYFNPFRKVRSNYGCWQDVPPTPVEGIVFARRTVSLLPTEYFLIKPGEKAKLHRIDSFLRETGEYRRFQFAFRRVVGNDLAADVKIYQDHIHLKLRFYLPEWENRLLESFAWPCNSVSDKLEWDMPLSIWAYIKIYLEKLGIVVREEMVDG